MALPVVLRHRDFDLYWSGVVLSQIGTRGTVAANLFQVYALTGSVAQTGLVGLGAPYEWTGQAFFMSFRGGGGDPGDFGRFVAFTLGSGTMVLVAALLATLFAKAASAPDTRMKLARIGTLLLAGGASIVALVVMFS